MIDFSTSVNITDAGKEYIISTLTKLDKPILIVGQEGGGCAGFKYFWLPVDKDEYEAHGSPDDIKMPLNDDKTLIVDGVSLMYIAGSTIDYVTDFVNSQLVVVNPNTTSSCGCGKSVSF